MKHLLCLRNIAAVTLAAVLPLNGVYAQESCGAEVCLTESSSEIVPAAQVVPQVSAARTQRASADELEISTITYTEEQRVLADGITADLNARRLMRPDGNNALQKIRELQALLPTHDYSVNGERYIARVYMVLGRAAVEKGQVEIARQRLQSAIKLDQKVKGQQSLTEAISTAASNSEALVNTRERNNKNAKPVNPSSKAVIANYADASKKLEVVVAAPADKRKPVEFVAPMMVAIPAGKFVMGSEAGAEDEKPMREVTVEAFSMSKYEITVEQYRVFAIENDLPAPHFSDDDRSRPVANVSWEDAQSYVAWLSGRTEKKYRLPSEAQWEYAARAGTMTPYNTGEDLVGVANCVGCGSEWDGRQTAPVGSFDPNAFGLYDMHGNVWEWVQDCWSDNYFGRGDDAAAVVRAGCARRVMRGGSWYNEADYARVSYRGNEDSGFRNQGVGFRVMHDGL